MANIRKFKPLLDRVLVERFAPELKTKGGILLPEKSQGKVLDATVIAVGPGKRDMDGKTVNMVVGVGDRVFLPEFGGTKIEVDNKEYHLFREADILGTWQS